MLLILVSCGISMTITGCGGTTRPPGMPKLYPVTISVIQDDKPLADAVVTLIPEEVGNQWSSGGATDAKGQLKPMTYSQFPGVPEGKYKVCISKQELVGEMDFSDPASPRGNQQLFEVIDPVFKSKDTTTLEMEVSPKSKNNVSFDVGKSVKIKAAIPGA
jgi:hypothetical protein